MTGTESTTIERNVKGQSEQAFGELTMEAKVGQ
jgi:hypothetical protein